MWRPLPYTLYLTALLLIPILLHANDTTQLENPHTRAQQAYTQGAFDRAQQQWEQILTLPTLTPTQRYNALFGIALTQQARGELKQATTYAEQALIHAQDDSVMQAKTFILLSDLALSNQNLENARRWTNQSLNLLNTRELPPIIRASLLNQQGNVLMVEGYFPEASIAYQQAITYAVQANEPLLTTKLWINQAHAQFKQQQIEKTLLTLREANTAIQQANPTAYATLKTYISIGELILRLYPQLHHFPSDQRHTFQTIAHQALQTAQARAEAQKLNDLQIYAIGYLGNLYELEQQYTEALQLTRRAIFLAQTQSESRYRWQWQLGRILHAQQNTEAAIQAYRAAVDHLQALRKTASHHYRHHNLSFREIGSAVYFELADLLLRQAATTTNTTTQKYWLTEALDTIERLKSVEIQDYFQDECLATPQTRLPLPTATAALYPIALPNRLELLLSIKEHIYQFQIPISAKQLKNEINEFRFELETPDTQDFLPYAQRLYTWLIAPLQTTLETEKITTLIIIPDSSLRTIPLAALHDGKTFLIEQFAIATTLGLTLTVSSPLDYTQSKILITGLSQSVQGYPELNAVRNEVTAIERLYPKSTVLLDENFTTERLATTLRDDTYTLLHIASHGQFDSDPHNTFLLTFDSKLTMNRLEALIRLNKARKEPIDLLVLSACQTAVGDDQAALGLAGIALKAGAHSALASLWAIDDTATALLISEFYNGLQQKKLSRAAALQHAQRHLLKNTHYHHPTYWSPLLLLGNWF